MVKKIVIFFLILPIHLIGLSQHLQKLSKQEKFKAIHYTLEEGLTVHAMHTMIKDARGFLWVGSAQGQLSRFDGKIFKNYMPDLQKRGAINTDTIFSFKEDQLGNIWMGTARGLSRYDIKADTFTNFSPLIDSAFDKLTIAPFWSTQTEIFCKEPGPIITAIDLRTLRRVTMDQFRKQIDPFMEWNANKSFFDVKTKSIWMLASYKVGNGGMSLLQISSSGASTYYSWPCYKGNKRHRQGAEDIVYDSARNSIWVNSGEGILEFSLVEKKFHRIEALNAFTKLENYDRGVGIEVDKTGRIWFSTLHNGILIYHPETEAIRELFSEKDLQQRVGQDNLHIYCDKDGIMWTSNWSEYGIFEILPDDPPVTLFSANSQKRDSLSNPSIFGIQPAMNGEIWIGTEDGLNILDTRTNKVRVLRQRDLPGLSGNLIVPVYIDTIRRKAVVVCAQSGGPFAIRLYEMDMSTMASRPIVFRGGTERLDTVSVLPGWIQPYGKGLLFFDEQHGIFEIRENSLFADLVTPFKTTVYYKPMLVQERYLFIIGPKAIRSTFENKGGKWTQTVHKLDSVPWTRMYYDRHDQTTWVHVKKRLIHYDKDFREIRSYGPEEGYNFQVVGMMTDNAGNLWFTNSIGQLSRLNITQDLITNLSQADGYAKQPHGFFSQTVDAHGDIYFGSGNLGNIKSGSLVRISPEKYSSPVTSSVYLRSLLINQKPFSLSVAIDNVEELSLRYNQNTITLETGIIDHHARGEGSIRYKLEADGKKTDWQYVPNYYSIRYEKLPPGKYKLTLQASNSVNEFNSPVKIIMINISPAFWNTWWFRLIALAFLVDLIYTFIRWRLKQKYKLQLERTEKERQIADIKQKATEMEMQALRAQMNPHFIFNSLNSINRFILQNNRTQASEYLTKFSKLVRMILQNSQAPLIPLESELESLNLYLDLESVRFDHKFDYKISYPKDLDIEVLKVPPLIIQPYTENAIWHGLMHKEERGQLAVDVSQNDDYLYFKITDNGIGRKKAAELASKSATKHKSMGLRITKDRIAMLEKTNGTESPVKIIDLENDDGSAAGTEVIIKMPAIYE